MEAIVGLGIIEAFSYVLLYYTFIHSLNRYERKKDKIFYIAASLAVVVRLAAIVLDKEKTAVCMDRGINIGSGQNGSLYGYLCAMYRFTDRTFTGDKYKRQQCFLQNESGYELHFLCICGKTGGRCIFL